MTTERIKEELRSLLEYRPEVKLCFLFGSAATGSRRPGSDIDVAVCAERPFSPDYLGELQLEMSERFHAEVDLLDISRLDGLILRQVLGTGARVINRNPSLLARHIKRVLYFSEDMLPNYRIVATANVKRFIHGS